MFRVLAVCFLALRPLASGAEKTPRTKTTTKHKLAHTKAAVTDQPAKPETPSDTESESSDGPAETKEKPQYGRPAMLGTDALKEFESLPEDRKKLISGALAVANESPWLPYLFGGSDPKDGGFDCSGAMYFVMRKAALDPPRTSAEQYLWVKDGGRLHEIEAAAITLADPSLGKLLPGDLLFWGGTYAPVDGRKVNVTHVALFLGHEKKDGRPVMINATDGRAYRGTKANGFGVYDFQMPREGARAVFMGYGTPPGIGRVE